MSLGAREAHRIGERKERVWRDEFETKESTVNGKKFLYYDGTGPIPKNETLENGFYGHYLPSHFKKTSIVRTTGVV